MRILHLQVSAFRAGHVPDAAPGAGDSGVKEIVLGPAELAGIRWRAVERAASAKSERPRSTSRLGLCDGSQVTHPL